MASKEAVNYKILKILVKFLKMACMIARRLLIAKPVELILLFQLLAMFSSQLLL